jgi:cytochrome c1
LALGVATGVLAGVLALAAQALASPGAGSSPALSQQPGPVERGRELFSLYCTMCHQKAGVPFAFGMTGPDLTDFEQRPLIAGFLPNTSENLARWLFNPPALKPDSMMPPPALSAVQVNDLVAFLLPHPDPTPEKSAAVAPEEDPIPPANFPF